MAPLLWNFVILESEVRFDWVDTRELERRHELEKSLIFDDFTKFDCGDLDPMIRQNGRIIHAIRGLANRTVGKDTRSYHLGILYNAVRRLTDLTQTYL